MNFTVIWLPGAEDELAALWLDATLRLAVTRASNLIDQKLRADPTNAGESRPGGRRIVFEPPLGVLFKVDAQNALVTVIHVWSYGKHGQAP